MPAVYLSPNIWIIFTTIARTILFWMYRYIFSYLIKSNKTPMRDAACDVNRRKLREQLIGALSMGSTFTFSASF